MPNRTDPVADAARLARGAVREIGRELRLARIQGGMTQGQVARRIGTSASRVSRFETGQIADVSTTWIYRLAAAVGMRAWLRAVPGGRRLLDQPQLALLGRLRDRVHRAWQWQLEEAVPRPNDMRAADAVLSIPGCRIVVEAITRLADFQAQLRACQLKARDLGADRLVLLVSATSANREALRVAGPVVTAALPIGTRRALAALADGRDPGGDAVIVL